MSLLALACSGDAPRDAGADAGPAPRDAGYDAGYDVGPRDAGHDAAGDDAGPPGAWSLLPGLPDGCVVEYTTDSSELEPFTREACPERSGCERLTPTWEWGIVELRVDGGVGGEGSPMFFFTRDGPLGGWQKWLVDAEGVALFGVRGHLDGCYPGPFGAARSAFAFAIREPAGDFNHNWVYRGDTETDGVRLTNHGRLSDLVPGTSSFSSIRVGSSRTAVESAPRHTIIDVPRAAAAVMVADGADGGETYVSAVIGDTVFYDVYGGAHHIRAATDGERGRVLIDPVDAEAMRILTDGTEMAWIQAYGRVASFEFERLELWASPYAERAEDLEPRRVADLSFTNPYPRASMGAGYVTFVEWDASAMQSVLGVYRLSDGARAEIPAPGASTYWNAAAYITADVLAVGTGIGGPPPRDFALRIHELDTLTFVAP